MTVLGEAFIEVRGDVRPFARDLERELKTVADRIEKSLSNSIRAGLADAGRFGEEEGAKLGDRMGRGMGRSMGDKKKSWWISISSALASALDDGISALPMEAKAAIVGALILVSPLLAGGIAGAVSAGLGAGIAGLGTLLAFQYQEVEDRGAQFASRLRRQLVDSAAPFLPAVIHAMDIIEQRFQKLDPQLDRLFAKSSKFLEPITNGLLDFLDRIVVAFNLSGDNIEGFVIELGYGLRVLGDGIAVFIRALADTGETGQQAFADLIYLISVSIAGFGKMVAFLTEIYGIFRLWFEVFGFAEPAVNGFVEGAERGILVTRDLGVATSELSGTFPPLITRTEEEEARLRDLDKALKGATEAAYGMLDANISWERSLDDINEALKENGATLDITTEKGRTNAEEFVRGLKAAEQQALTFTATGKMSAVEAAGFYDQQITTLRKMATQAGLTGAQFDLLYGDIIAAAQLKLDANAMGITDTERELAEAKNQASQLLSQLKQIQAFRLPAGGTRRFSEYAEGGIVTHPTQALIGEAGPEVVIPLTKPSRAAELMQRSGLSDMISAPAQVVNVYVGNEQLETHMFRVVEGNNMALSNSLAYGARGL